MFNCTRLAETESPVTDTLSLTYEERLKSRQLLVLASGETVHCLLPAGTCLRHGDKLLVEDADEKRVVLIEAAPEPLIEGRADDALHFARSAYHLGNRHVKIEIGEDQHGMWLRFQPDHVLEAMLNGLGCHLMQESAPFQPEGGAYGGHNHRHGQSHPHRHDHGDQGHHHGPENHGGPKIHSFDP